MTRTVTVALRAVNAQFDSSYKTSAGHVKALGDETTRTAGRARQASSQMGRDGLLLGGIMLAGFGLAGNAMMKFQKQMSEVGAVSGANIRQLKQLSDAALQAGKVTVFSANDAAAAEAELAKAGVSVADILGGGLTGALNLASAGQLGVADAASIAATTMTQFGLKGADVAHIADDLAAGANKALGSVQDLGMGLKYVGPIAGQLGISLDQTVGTLSELAQNGIIAEQAGTSLRGMIMALTSPSKIAQKEMDLLGISVFDARGKFVGFDGVAGELQQSLGKLTEKERSNALGRIFGNEQITAARVLYKGGAEDVRKWTDAVNKDGYAAQLAAQKMNNLAGDVENLKGSLETAFIKSGSTVNGALRGMTQGANALVGAYIDLPAPVQTAATALAGIGGATLVAGGAVLMLIPKIAELDAALLTMTGGAVGAKGALLGIGKVGAVGAALVGVGFGVDALSRQFEKTPPEVDALAASLLEFASTAQMSGALAKLAGQDYSDLGAKVKLAAENTLTSWVNPFQDSHVDIDDARNSLDALDRALASLVTSGNADVAARQFALMKNQMILGGADQGQIDRFFNDYLTALDGVAVQAGTTGASVAGTNVTIRDQAAAAKEAADGLKKQLDALKALTDPMFAMESALAGSTAAQAAYTKAIHDHGAKSKEAEAALFGVAKAAADVTSAAKTLQTGVESGTTSVGQMKDQLSSWVSQGLMTRTEADRLGVKLTGLTGKAKTLSDTPANVAVSTTGVPKTLTDLGQVDRAKRETSKPILVPLQISNLAQFVAAIKSARAVGSTGTPTNPFLPGGLDTVPKRADGSVSPEGLVRGRGGPRSDSLLARISPGEFIVKASATARNLPLLRAMNADTPGFASGMTIPAAPVFRPTRGSESSQALGLARRGGTVEQIRALSAAYDDYIHKLDQAAQREKLLGDIRTAQADRAKAKAKEHAAAQQQVNDAIAALHAFDQAAYQDAQKAATDRLITSLEKEAQARADAAQAAADQKAAQRAAEDNAYEVGARTAAQQIASLDKRLAAEKKFSDAWMAIWRQRQQVMQDVTDASDRAAADLKQAADDAQNAYSSRLDRLNQLLDSERSITAQRENSQQQFTIKQADLLAQQRKAEADFQASSAKAAADYASAEQQILSAREQALTGWASISERSKVTWGNTLDQLQGNVEDQTAAFQEWIDQLASARGRGVSQAVISALGLDQGPQALGQLRQFAAATTVQIDALNAAVATRTALAGQEVHAEQVGQYGQLATDLAAAQQQYTDAIGVLQQQYQTSQADLAAQLQQAEIEFAAEQAQYAAQLADLGTDQAHSYGEALAAGLRSQIPAVRAAAQELLAAAANLAAAQAAAQGPAPAAPTSAGAVPYQSALTASANVDLSTLPAHSNANDARIASTAPGSLTARQIAYADIYRVPLRTFDVGGYLQPGLTLAYNGTGKPEEVVATGQRAAAPGQTMLENHTYVVLDGQIIDHRVERTFGKRKSKAEIAGTMP